MYHVRHRSKPADMLVAQTCAAGFFLGMLIFPVAGVIYALHTLVGSLV